MGGKVAHFENDTVSENSPRIKTPYPYLMNLVSNYLEKNILSNTVKKNQWHLINDVVEITDQNRCILFGPPCIIEFNHAPNNCLHHEYNR